MKEEFLSGKIREDELKKKVAGFLKSKNLPGSPPLSHLTIAQMEECRKKGRCPQFHPLLPESP
jgi:hypothetical protein